MKLKSRLPPFSLICIQCRHVFCFDFIVFYLWVNSVYTRWQSRHTTWFQIPYLGSCSPSIDRKISQVSSAKCLASLIQEPIFFQIYMGLLEFGFKLIVFFFWKSVQILFTDRALLTIRLMVKILGNVSPLPYSPKVTVVYGELCVYFAVQILPLIDWTWMAEMTLEFASSSSVKWRGTHQWAITCLIGVVILRTVTQRWG